MKFIKIIEEMQKRHKGSLVLVQCGIFYIGVGKDATTLNKYLGLEKTCYSEGVCKAGVPQNSLKKYMEMLKEKEISTVIYTYTIDEKAEFTYGVKKYKKLNIITGHELEEENIANCNSCKHNIKDEIKHPKNILKTLKMLKETINKAIEELEEDREMV